MTTSSHQTKQPQACTPSLDGPIPEQSAALRRPGQGHQLGQAGRAWSGTNHIAGEEDGNPLGSYPREPGSTPGPAICVESRSPRLCGLAYLTGLAARKDGHSLPCRANAGAVAPVGVESIDAGL